MLGWAQLILYITYRTYYTTHITSVSLPSYIYTYFVFPFTHRGSSHFSYRMLQQTALSRILCASLPKAAVISSDLESRTMLRPPRHRWHRAQLLVGRDMLIVWG